LHRKRENILIHGASEQMHLPDSGDPGVLISLGCDKLITPDCIRAMYKIPLATKSHPQNSLGMFQEDNYFHTEDLDLFFENQTTNIPLGTRPLEAMIANADGDGDGSSSKFGLESALDLQVAYPIIYPQTITIYQTNDHLNARNSSHGFLDSFLNAIDKVSTLWLNLFFSPGSKQHYSHITPTVLWGNVVMAEEPNPTLLLSLATGYSVAYTNPPTSFRYRMEVPSKTSQLHIRGDSAMST
jgi:tripeptidyl-peptidase-1